MENFVTSGHLGLRDLFKDISVNTAALDELDETSLEFLHATVSADTEEMKKRIIDITAVIYALHPYPSLRGFHHVALYMPQHPVYPKVLAAGKSGKAVFAEIGCCIGSEVRKLAYDGYAPSNIIGIDIFPNFITAGHDLYRDHDTTPIRFIAADIFTAPTSFERPAPSASETALNQVIGLGDLQGTLTHVSTMLVFHLFDEQSQYELAKRIVAMLKREPGAVVFGRQGGFEHARQLKDPVSWKTNRWGHSPTSWTQLWKKVFAEAEGELFAETRVRVTATLERVLEHSATDHSLVWSVEII